MAMKSIFPFKSVAQAATARCRFGTSVRQVRMTVCASVLAVLFMASSLVVSEPLSLNFRDTNVRQIIESVGELTGRNFMVDPRVRGKVTIIANQPVPEEALYDVLLSILRMNGFRAVEGEYVTRILPANIAPRYSPEFLEGPPYGGTEDLVTTFMPIRHINAASVLPLVKPLMTAEAKAILHKETNSLLITEIASNVRRVMRIIGKVDVADVGDFEIISLDYTEAGDIVNLVQRASNKNLRHLVQIVADKQGNRIVMTGPEKMRIGLRALIAELDSETGSDASGRIKVIRLHYARAEDIEQIVRGLLSSAEFIKTLSGSGEEIVTTVRQQPAPKKAKGKAKEKAKGDDAQDTGKMVETRKKAAPGKRNYVIEVDRALNALIVGGPPKVIEAVERVVREIDVPRPQVLIEAIFADVTETRALSLSSELTGAKPGLLEGANISVADDRFIRGLGAVFDLEGFRIGGQASVGGNAINLLIRALRTDMDSRVLSTPSILTLNNEEASIDVSDVLSVRTGTVAAGDSVRENIERQEFGTELKVTPQITEGDAVRLDIKYKTEEVGDRSIGPRTEPDSKKREISTTVLVDDGDILVLGGLSNESATEMQNRVPLLSRIPILGHLFRGRSSDRNRTTLMVFIRPTILRNAEEGGEESRRRYAELRLEQLLDAQNVETLLPDERQMVLPELPLDRDGGEIEEGAGGSGIDAEPGRKVKRKIIKRRKIRREES